MFTLSYLPIMPPHVSEARTDSLLPLRTEGFPTSLNRFGGITPARGVMAAAAFQDWRMEGGVSGYVATAE